MPTILRELPYLPEDEVLEEYERSVLIISKRRVLRLLFKNSEPLPIADILSKAKISLNSLAAIFQELGERGYMERSDRGVYLTQKGRIWALKNRKELFMYATRVVWKPTTTVQDSEAERLRANTSLPRGYTFSRIDLRRFTR